MSTFGHDDIGAYKALPDGSVLRVERRMYNSLLTLSSSKEDMGWSHGW